MVNPNVKYTVRDYMHLPESEEKRYELIEGDLYMVPSPTTGHQRTAGTLFMALNGFVRSRRLGEVLAAPLDVVLSEHDVLQPDLIFISSARSGIATDANIQGAPDLVVEILSPSTAGRDRTVKRARYARYGVREYWIVDPESRSIEVLRAGESGLETDRVYPEGTVVTSPVLEGLRLDVSGIFG
jgi:Uma2 family endonuclease